MRSFCLIANYDLNVLALTHCAGHIPPAITAFIQKQIQYFWIVIREKLTQTRYDIIPCLCFVKKMYRSKYEGVTNCVPDIVLL